MSVKTTKLGALHTTALSLSRSLALLEQLKLSVGMSIILTLTFELVKYSTVYMYMLQVKIKFRLKLLKRLAYSGKWTWLKLAWLAQLEGHRSSEREVAGSNPSWTHTQGFK